MVLVMAIAVSLFGVLCVRRRHAFTRMVYLHSVKYDQDKRDSAAWAKYLSELHLSAEQMRGFVAECEEHSRNRVGDPSTWRELRQHWERKINSNNDEIRLFVRAIERVSSSEEYHRRLKRKYERAARYPWLPVEPDPPEQN